MGEGIWALVGVVGLRRPIGFCFAACLPARNVDSIKTSDDSMTRYYISLFIEDQNRLEVISS